MSSTINKYGTVRSLDSVQRTLIPETRTNAELLRDDDYDNRWNWDSSDLIYNEENEISKRNNDWLNECIIAISPFYDMLVIAKSKTAAIFKSKFDSNPEKNDFNLLQCKTFITENEEEISNLLLLPIVSQKKSLATLHDWTAILVGFTSGYFRIYAENGKPILSHIFHAEPILDIKCQTYSANNLLSDQFDEVLVVYPTAVVQIDGLELYKTLRLYRNRLANSYYDSSASAPNKDTSLTFKKWKLQTSTEGKTFDCVNIGSIVRNNFDALVSHSIDLDNPVKNETANLFIATGTDPYVGFYHVHEGISHAIIDELSHALLNKVKNVFSFFSSSETPVDPLSEIKTATNVPCHLSLYDSRLGVKICVSPNRRFAAIVDDFARVIVFDIANSIAVNILKGYRNVQIGWIVVEEETSAGDYPKQANFLVIYLKKRGILELFCSQNGPRVSSFNVGKNCQLLYVDHTMFGLNHPLLKIIRDRLTPKEYRQQFFYPKCYLFSFETGELFTIDVPFLCALTDKNCKKALDIQIFKDMKALLKGRNEIQPDKIDKFYEDVHALILMLHTVEIRRECLEYLAKNSNDVTLICTCAEKLYGQLKEAVDKEELDFENKLLLQMCARIMQICRFYIRVNEQKTKLFEKVTALIEESASPPEIYQLIEKLGDWSGNDVARILSLLAFRQSVLKTNDINAEDFRCEIDFDFSISEMLSHFTLYYSHLVKNNNVECYESLPVEIILMEQAEDQTQKQESTYVSNEKLSVFLFCCTFCGDEKNLDHLLNEACIFPSNLLLLLFTAWLECHFSLYWPFWQSFAASLFKIVDVMNNMRVNDDIPDSKLFFDSTSYDDRLLSPSWTDIIELIYNSNNITSAFISINMIRALINKFKPTTEDGGKRAESDSPDPVELATEALVPSDNEWETLHLDKENLSLLTKQFEDLFLLDMLLKINRETARSAKSSTNTWNPISDASTELDIISLRFILDSGPGIVSEIVARWAVYHRIDPKLLITTTAVEAEKFDEDYNSLPTNQLKASIEESNVVTESTDLSGRSTLMEILDHVRRCFPNCLEADILLINCAWEIVYQWHKQPLVFSGELYLSLAYLEMVSNSVLKHNIASMVWRLFIQNRFEILCNLIEKMRKKPKDRICRKELSMDENNLEQFVAFSCNLLKFMIDTSCSSETEPLPIYSIDDWWIGGDYATQYTSDFRNPNLELLSDLTTERGENRHFSQRYHVPLAVAAIHQKAPIINLIIEYFQLAMIVQFVVMLNARSVQPLSLFPSPVRAYFFKDLYSFLPASGADSNASLPSDTELIESRTNFLSTVITTIVKTLPAHRNDEDLKEARKFYLTANKWFGKVLILAREWELEADQIRLLYVNELYLFGCDPLADELLPTVTDIESLSRKLMTTAGQRLARYFESQRMTLDEISFLPPGTLFWLKSLVHNANCFDGVPLSSTKLLLEKISSYLYSDKQNLAICQEMLAAIDKLA